MHGRVEKQSIGDEEQIEGMDTSTFGAILKREHFKRVTAAMF